ncbi:hypothetical protein LEP1GSC024_1204 [Leptospira noguchii str. 2001034031]|uniref:Uncharacterized protein n=1 Tax=Leptospira noguchii str. 2001034031 TaxID=1193053 RepID=M6YC49_9LEPT|nr:hypothetical protein LEP1GSC024_1204 [Leptospira noguchii str. 2001034031]
MGLGKNNFTKVDLQSLGVRRISIGGSLARACFYLIRQAALEMLSRGTFNFAEAQLTHKELCDFFSLITNYWTHFYAAFTSNCTGLTKSNDE